MQNNNLQIELYRALNRNLTTADIILLGYKFQEDFSLISRTNILVRKGIIIRRFAATIEFENFTDKIIGFYKDFLNNEESLYRAGTFIETFLEKANLTNDEKALIKNNIITSLENKVLLLINLLSRKIKGSNEYNEAKQYLLSILVYMCDTQKLVFRLMSMNNTSPTNISICDEIIDEYLSIMHVHAISSDNEEKQDIHK